MASRGLTKRSVDALTCPAGKDRAFLWDGTIRGFGVVAHPSGKRTYILQYRFAGRSRRLALGDHGRITVDQARRLAQKATGAIADGKDPVEARRQEGGGKSFAELADAYMRLHVKTKRKGSTYAEYDRLLKLHLRPKLGSRKAMALVSTDIAGLHSSMSDRPGAANRTVTLFSSIWNWAVRTKALPFLPNPAAGIEPYPEEGGERFLTKEESARLGAALRLAETKGIRWIEPKKPSKHRPKTQTPTIVDPYAVAALRLLILTGARLREILHARWANFDKDRGILFLGDSKTGRKPIYLSGAVVRLIEAVPRNGDDPFVIAGGKEHRNKKGDRIYKPRADLKRPWSAIRREAKLEGFRLHDLRHSFASTGAGGSLGLPILGKLLGHARPETTARYAHLAADPMLRAAEAITDQIIAAMEK